MMETPALIAPVRAVCFDWGGTLMIDDGPSGVPMVQWPEVSAVAGARECLAALYGRLPLCVATNAGQSDRGMIEMALERVDLLRFIGEIFCFTEIGCSKDSPEFWREVTARLAVAPAEIVMIGDSLEHDVQAPRRAGIQAVRFTPGRGEPDGQATEHGVADLREFARLVEPCIS
jgi:FMN phosphatase YigB (HAD superfamily)